MGNKTSKVKDQNGIGILIEQNENTISTAIPKIQEQPNEVLEHIFKQLPRLTELLNCSNTCLRWKKIVEGMYKDRGSRYIQVSKYFPNDISCYYCKLLQLQDVLEL